MYCMNHGTNLEQTEMIVTTQRSKVGCKLWHLISSAKITDKVTTCVGARNSTGDNGNCEWPKKRRCALQIRLHQTDSQRCQSTIHFIQWQWSARLVKSIATHSPLTRFNQGGNPNGCQWCEHVVRVRHACPHPTVPFQQWYYLALQSISHWLRIIGVRIGTCMCKPVIALFER